jgi:hypothetical protein
MARVVVTNPSRPQPKRSTKTMARTKEKKSAAKKKRAKKKRETPVQTAAPKKTRKRSGEAKTSGGAKKKRAYKYKPRFKANAVHKNYNRVREHKRRTNPAGQLVTAGIAAGAGILAYLVVLAGTYYATKDSAQQSRNRKIIVRSWRPVSRRAAPSPASVTSSR